MKLIIKLGANVRPFTASRKLQGLSYLGTVQRGLQIGALAKSVDGEYFQVNGDIKQPLNLAKVDHALRIAQIYFDAAQERAAAATNERADDQPPASWQRLKTGEGAARPAPTVIVRPRRRQVTRPLHASQWE